MDAVVEGTVVRSGDRVRVTAQLIHARTDHHLWARTYERELRDVRALHTELAGAIAQALEVKVRPEELRRLAGRGTVDPEAYDAYLKGRFFLNKRSPQGLARAVEFFERAIERDPNYAPAYSGLSDSYRMFGLQGAGLAGKGLRRSGLRDHRLPVAATTGWRTIRASRTCCVG